MCVCRGVTAVGPAAYRRAGVRRPSPAVSGGKSHKTAPSLPLRPLSRVVPALDRCPSVCVCVCSPLFRSPPCPPTPKTARTPLGAMRLSPMPPRAMTPAPITAPTAITANSMGSSSSTTDNSSSMGSSSSRAPPPLTSLVAPPLSSTGPPIITRSVHTPAHTSLPFMTRPSRLTLCGLPYTVRSLESVCRA
jgi:hypothetical protein